MAETHSLKKLKFDNKDVVAEVAIRDDKGNVISDTYIDNKSDEIIDGRKSFLTNPKSKRGTITPRIPEEYQEVESLLMNSTVNTSFVNFGIQWKDAGKITSRIKVYANNTSTMIFGVGSKNGPYIALSRCNSLTNPNPNAFTSYTDLAWHDFSITFTAVSTSNICTSWYDGTWAKKISYGETKIYDNDNNILVDAIPCIRRTDEVAGFYDTINDTFLVNSGTQKILFENPLDTVWYPEMVALTDIDKKDFHYSDQPLSALKVGNRTYRLVQQGTTDNSYPSGEECGIAIGYNSYSARAHGMAIGSNANAGNANTTCAIGNGAKATGPRATSLGYGAQCAGDYSAAIGPSSYNIIKNSTTFDRSSSGQYFHMLNPSYLFFRYQNQVSGKVNISDYTEGKSLQDLLDEKQNALPPLPDDASEKTYVLKAVKGVMTWVEE